MPRETQLFCVGEKLERFNPLLKETIEAGQWSVPEEAVWLCGRFKKMSKPPAKTCEGV